MNPGKDDMPKHKHKTEPKIDGSPRDFTEVAREKEVTSNDGRFSTYQVAPKKDHRDGDLILQQRGRPDAS